MLAFDENERPVAIQIYGGDPDRMDDAAAIVEEQGVDIVDINMGCPVRKIVNSGAGSAMLKDFDKAARVVEKIRKRVKIPVTVKVRKGWESDDVLPLLKRFEEIGVAAIAIHGRTRNEAYTGASDWAYIAHVKSELSIPVWGNGDVKTPADAMRMFERRGVDGVMIGRAALHNPFIFRDIARARRPARRSPTNEVERRIDAMQRYLGKIDGAPQIDKWKLHKARTVDRLVLEGHRRTARTSASACRTSRPSPTCSGSRSLGSRGCGERSAGSAQSLSAPRSAHCALTMPSRRTSSTSSTHYGIAPDTKAALYDLYVSMGDEVLEVFGDIAESVDVAVAAAPEDTLPIRAARRRAIPHAQSSALARGQADAEPLASARAEGRASGLAMPLGVASSRDRASDRSATTSRFPTASSMLGPQRALRRPARDDLVRRRRRGSRRRHRHRHRPRGSSTPLPGSVGETSGTLDAGATRRAALGDPAERLQAGGRAQPRHRRRSIAATATGTSSRSSPRMRLAARARALRIYVLRGEALAADARGEPGEAVSRRPSSRSTTAPWTEVTRGLGLTLRRAVARRRAGAA